MEGTEGSKERGHTSFNAGQARMVLWQGIQSLCPLKFSLIFPLNVIQDPFTGSSTPLTKLGKGKDGLTASTVQSGQ